MSGNVNRFVRARGYYATGLENASGSIVESIRQVYIACPTIVPTPLASGIAGLPYAAAFASSGALGIVSFTTASAPASRSDAVARRCARGHADANRDLSRDRDGDRRLERLCRLARAHAHDQSGPDNGAGQDVAAFRFALANLRFVPLPVVVGTGNQTVRLTQSGAGTVSWTATSSHPSIIVTPSSGIGSATLSIGIQRDPLPTSLTSGTATITFAFSGTTSAPGPIAVTVSVSPSPQTTLGVIDTPLDNGRV